MTTPSPWKTPDASADGTSEFINFGLIEITSEARQNKTFWYLVRIAGTPINGNFTINRTVPSFDKKAYVNIFLPSMQTIVGEHDFLTFPAPPTVLKEESDIWEFYAQWRMRGYRSYRQDDILYYTDADEDKILEDKSGKKYVIKTTFEFLAAYPNQAACMVAMEKEFPTNPEDDIPGFDTPQPAATTPQPAIALESLLPMMLNGVWDKDAEHFNGLEDALTAVGTVLSDRETRIIVYHFMATKAGENDTNIKHVKDEFEMEFGQIDADEWAEAISPF